MPEGASAASAGRRPWLPGYLQHLFRVLLLGRQTTQTESGTTVGPERATAGQERKRPRDFQNRVTRSNCRRSEGSTMARRNFIGSQATAKRFMQIA